MIWPMVRLTAAAILLHYLKYKIKGQDPKSIVLVKQSCGCALNELIIILIRAQIHKEPPQWRRFYCKDSHYFQNSKGLLLVFSIIVEQ